jgi:hypothetical protein
VPFTAVLDASGLYLLPLRDTLRRVAEAEPYDPLWSERILDEVARNLIADRRATEQQVERLLAAMRGAFDAASVPAFRASRNPITRSGKAIVSAGK